MKGVKTISKYKVGDKIVLTVSDVNEKAYYSYYVFNNNDLILWEPSTDKYAEPLSNYTEPLSNKVADQRKEINHLLRKIKEKEAAIERLEDELRSRAQKLTWQKGVEAGQKEAWELARKIALQPINGGYKRSEFEEIFGCGYISDIFEKYTYPAAAAKVEAWEKAKEEIKVGDVVSHEEKYGVVISEGTICFRGFTDDGTPFEWYKERCKKTGRHIDIDSFLKQIGGKE